MVGRVDAPMGTTEWETYSLKLKGLNREILVTDTPGFRGRCGWNPAASWQAGYGSGFAVVRGG